MLIHIIYGTNSSSAKSIGEIIGASLEKSGHKVQLINAATAEASDIQKADLTIIGSCTWELWKGTERLEGQLQQHWLDFIKRLKSQKFTDHHFAVYGVGDSGYQHFCAAADHLEQFVTRVGGKQIGTTLRVDSFYFMPENEKLVQTWARQLDKDLTRA